MIDEILSKIEKHLNQAKNPLIVLLGPTASGKTKLSLLIANSFNGEILSTDSRQIYTQMNIGTDSLLPEEQDGVPHHMLNFLDPNQHYSLSDYKKDAEKIIQDIYKRDKVPMLVGGTGLYISAIVDEYQLSDAKPDFKLRAKLEKEAEKKGNEYVHAQLAKVDPEAAEKIHPNNLRYVMRAIEINQQTNKPKKNRKSEKGDKRFDTIFIGLDWARDILYERINHRVDLQFERGLVEEVKTLMDKIKDPSAPAFSSLGCKEIIEYLEGNISVEEASELIKKNTRNYAKRQLTWFRKNKEINWLDGPQVEQELKTRKHASNSKTS